MTFRVRIGWVPALQSAFSAHGILGYSSLTGMLIDATLIWKFRLSGKTQYVPKGLHLYTRIASAWWILAYITGAILIARR